MNYPKTQYGKLSSTGNMISCRLRFLLDNFNQEVLPFFNQNGIRKDYEYGIHSNTKFKGRNFITVDIICSREQYVKLLVLSKKRQIDKLNRDIEFMLLSI